MKARSIVIGTVILAVGLPLMALLVVRTGVWVLDRNNGSITSLGQKREYLLHVPASYDPAKATPLVISLHGAMNWPALQMHLSQWNKTADEYGFIVVYPGGVDPLHLGPRAWFMTGADTPSHMPDVVYISALIDSLAAAYHLDSTRIYASGFSNGGGMAFVLSCTLPHRIAAIGAVAAAQSLPFSWCPDSTPVPMLAFHGTADPLVPYTGLGPGRLNPRPLPDVRAWAASWAQRNHCSQPGVDSVAAPEVTRLTFTRCAHDATVALYTVTGGGHQWFGGNSLPRWLVGPGNDGVDATKLMWAFFRAHPLRQGNTPEPE